MINAITLLKTALTVAFLYFGIRKLIGYHVDIGIYEAIGFGQFPRYITGSVEVLGAILLWVRGAEGFAGMLLLTTICIGLSALLIWVGPPYWHMFVLIAGTSSVVWIYRDQFQRLIR
ncbi:hypothetical protein [Yoonia sp. 2307UL14-13]|uniref:hypothetical protein n=1 Tax=Yoonia sp. 2307UL14-13 TaxID=3126506 RepID=UPI0030A1D52A